MGEVKALTDERRAEIRKIRNCIVFLDADCPYGIAETQRAIDELLATIDALTARAEQAEHALATLAESVYSAACILNRNGSRRDDVMIEDRLRYRTAMDATDSDPIAKAAVDKAMKGKDGTPSV